MKRGTAMKDPINEPEILSQKELYCIVDRKQTFLFSIPLTYKVFYLHFSIRCGTYNPHLHTTHTWYKVQ